MQLYVTEVCIITYRFPGIWVCSSVEQHLGLLLQPCTAHSAQNGQPSSVLGPRKRGSSNHRHSIEDSVVTMPSTSDKQLVASVAPWYNGTL